MPNIARTTKGDPDKPLTDKQRRFVEEYVVDMNATAAAVRAGYAHRKSGLWTLTMGLPHVKAAVERALAARRADTKAEAERLMGEYSRMAFANMADFLRVDEDGVPHVEVAALVADPATAAGVQKLSVEFFRDEDGRETKHIRRIHVQMTDKPAALKALLKLMGVESVRE